MKFEWKKLGGMFGPGKRGWRSFRKIFDRINRICFTAGRDDQR
jgi:hypothetical protein